MFTSVNLINFTPMNTQEQMIALLKAGNPQHFTKFCRFSFVIAAEEQVVITQFAGEDKPETKNTAKKGDYIVLGLAGEKYILTKAQFDKRYRIVGNLTAEAIGECWGIQYQGEEIEFEAPWRDKEGNPEVMNIKPGDYLVSPNPEFTEAYRVKKSEFDKTYKID